MSENLLKSGFFQKIQENLELQQSKKAPLIESLDSGLEFFEDFNESRLKLAFSSFSEEMKKALFEVIFFLHVNHEKFAEHKFQAYKKDLVHGIERVVPYEETICLYDDGTIYGVEGIEELPEIFKSEFEEYIKQEFDFEIQKKQDLAPIYSIASLGSIGTIGHKTYKSDLDLQVQYELEPFLVPEDEVTDRKLGLYLEKLVQYYAKLYLKKKGISAEKSKEKSVKSEAINFGKSKVKQKYLTLYRKFISREKLNNINPHECAEQIIDLYFTYKKIYARKEIHEKELKLKKRIQKIQDYVQAKYPEAEIYLFAYSTEDYRNGKHGSTLESKESSGSAYEKILNYEVLLPGIQFTPMVPSHFLFPQNVNSDEAFFKRLTNLIRFKFTDLYEDIDYRLVDLGSTPNLTMQYMLSHVSAVYWESFKASSGNLPKALLNLLRIEMLFRKGYQTTIIQYIKDISLMDEFQEDKESSQAESGISLFEIQEIEKKFPELLMDPWWLRYKTIKIGFSVNRKNPDEIQDLEQLSQTIDYCFALHVRLSEVFTRPGHRKEFVTHRDQVLAEFLKRAFPDESAPKIFLEKISIGEVESIDIFEKTMKKLFRESLNRTLDIVESYPQKEEDQKNRDEYKIWHHYYQANFEPPENFIQKNILNQLKEPRPRLQFAFKNKKWIFKSLQKSSSGGRFDTNTILDHLPDEVELLTHSSFLYGLAYCVQNGYYGALNKGTLKETLTAIEFDSANMDLGSKASNEFAYIRPDDVSDLVKRINEAFVDEKIDFRDCVKKETVVTDVYFFMHLLKYGQLSILYRNSLQQWFLKDYPLGDFEKNAYKYHQTYNLMFKSPYLHKAISVFLENNKFEINEQTTPNIHFWLNPNSADTPHGLRQKEVKVNDLAKMFRQFVLAVHTKK